MSNRPITISFETWAIQEAQKLAKEILADLQAGGIVGYQEATEAFKCGLEARLAGAVLSARAKESRQMAGELLIRAGHVPVFKKLSDQISERVKLLEYSARKLEGNEEPTPNANIRETESR